MDMDIQEILALVIVIAILVTYLISRKSRGKSGGCTGCDQSTSCHKPENNGKQAK